MSGFYKNCLNKTNFNERCSHGQLDSLNIDKEGIAKCFKDSFQNTDTKALSKNTLLDSELNEARRYGLTLYPSILVNNKTFLGNWKGKNLLEAVCAGTKEKGESLKEACNFYWGRHDRPIQESKGISAGWITFIIICIIIFNVVVIFFCRKYVQKKISERMSSDDIDSKINNVVSSYLQLRETR